MSNSKSVRSLLAGMVALAAVCGSEYAAAENPSGPYLGAGYGQFNVKVDDFGSLGDSLEDFDDEADAWKVFFGWRFNPHLSLELDYIDLGTPSSNFETTGEDGEYTTELSGIAGYAIGTLPLGIFELSGKVGYYFHDITVDVDTGGFGANNGDVLDSDESAEAFVYGVGAGVTFIDHINVLLEYEVMDLDEVDDAYTLWLTAAWRF